MSHGSSNDVPGPIQDSFVATVKPKQQRPVMADHVKRCGATGKSTMRRRHLFGYTVILVASFRRFALLSVPAAFRGELGDVNRSGWQQMFVTNGYTTNGGGWLSLYDSFCAAVA